MSEREAAEGDGIVVDADVRKVFVGGAAFESVLNFRFARQPGPIAIIPYTATRQELFPTTPFVASFRFADKTAHNAAEPNMES